MSTAMIIALAALTTLVVTTVAWFRKARQVAMPARRFLFVLGWLGAAALGAASFFMAGASWASELLGGLATIAGSALLGILSLAGQRAGEPIEIGATIPAFEAKDPKSR